MYKYFLMFFLLSFFLTNLGFSQEKTTSDELQQLNNRIELLEYQRDLLNQQLDLKSSELDLKFKSFELGHSQDIQHINTLIWVFGPLSILGVIGVIIGGIKTYFKLLEEATNIAEQKIDDKFEDFFNENKNHLKKLIFRENEENALKRQRKISVISHESSDIRFLRSFFDEMGFQNVQYYIYDVDIDLEKDIDILFINDEPGRFSKDQIENKLPKMSDEVVYFYFGGKRIDIDKNRLAIANFRSQLYGNLVNSMRYQEML